MPLIRFIAFGIAKTLSKVFGLATMAFFGRLPSRDDDKLAAIGLLSITWVPVVIAIGVPELAELLIPFAPEDEQVLRALAIAITILLPLTVGGLVALVHNRAGTQGPSRAAAMVHGFWYTPVIGLTVVAIVLVVPLLKAGQLARRFTVQRLLVMIPQGSFDETLERTVDVLRRRGLSAEVQHPNRLLATMFRLLGFILGHIFGRDVADRMRVIRGADADGGFYEVTLHASDVTILGRRKQASRVHAILAEELDERVVYFTWDDASQALEDRIREHRRDLDADRSPDLAEVRQLAEELAALQLDPEEWNNTRRLLYRLERDVYAQLAGLPDPQAEIEEHQRQEPQHGS